MENNTHVLKEENEQIYCPYAESNIYDCSLSQRSLRNNIRPIHRYSYLGEKAQGNAKLQD